MTKIKLLLAVSAILVLVLIGCEHIHEFSCKPHVDGGHYYICNCGETKNDIRKIHEFEWKDISSYETAYRECYLCGYREYQKDFYKNRVQSVSSHSGDPGTSSPIGFVVEAESGMYGYGEVFSIALELTIPRVYVADGFIYVKLAESPYFEIIGDGVQKANKTDEGTSENKYQLTFKIKPTNPCHLLQGFDFKIKFNPTDEAIEDMSEVGNGEWGWYYDSSAEYFYGFKEMQFINDSKGMLISDWDRRLFYDSINRELLSGVIDRDTYIDRLVEFNTLDSVLIQTTSGNTLRYISKKLRAEIIVGEEYNHFFDYDNFSDIRQDVLDKIFDTLLSNGLITHEQYEAEQEYISERGFCQKAQNTYYEFIPIADYCKENFYFITYNDMSKMPESIYCTESDNGSWATAYLSEEDIDIGDSVDVSVYAPSFDIIKSIEIDIQDGFSIDSEIRYVDDRMVFSVIHDENNISPRLKVYITLTGETEETFIFNLYGYCNEHKLYLSQWSAGEAYNIFYYQEQRANGVDFLSIEEISEVVSCTNALDNSYSVLAARDISPYDTFISGEILWKENASGSNGIFPAQNTLIMVYDSGAEGEYYLGSCVTGSDGKFAFGFTNDLSASENGYDIFLKVYAGGGDILVFHEVNNSDTYEAYFDEYEVGNDVSTGMIDDISIVYEMVDCSENTALFGQALQISQAAQFASKYYTSMCEEEIEVLPIVYPHTAENERCFFASNIGNNGSVHIVGNLSTYSGAINSYESWDMIMHEYGHFVAYMEGIINSSGGGHNITMSMAEHYKKHFKEAMSTDDMKVGCLLCENPNAFSESQSKIKGNSLSWSEGFATYFSMVSQEYAQENFGLGNVNTVGDGIYSSYNIKSENSVNVRTYSNGTESTEATVQSILYDLYDADTGEAFDTVALGHETMWSLIVGSGATTFDEFDDYFLNRCESADKEDLHKYGRLLRGFGIAPGNIVSNGAKTVQQPTFCFDWLEDSSTVYFDNRTFKLNFYDELYNYIGSTDEQSVTSTAGTYCITVDSTLWQMILNKESGFFVSVTVFENNTPKTEYEGEWFYFDSPAQTVVEDFPYSQTLDAGDYYWYKFVVPETSGYYFDTLGTADTVIEVLDNPVTGNSVVGLRHYYDDGGENGNVSFRINLTEGEIIYFRVRGENWTETGTFYLFICSVSHQHVYTHNYSKYNATKHFAYCECGRFVKEAHSWKIELGKSTCRECGYVSTGPVMKDDIPIIGEDLILYKPENEETE